MNIAEQASRLLAEIPAGVRILAAVKTRTPEEITDAIRAGIGLLGENYLQEAEAAKHSVNLPAEWHFIGHLQKNKVKKAVELFDVIETVDSYDLAREIDKRCAEAGKVMPVYIEVNSGREPQKSGVFPELVRAMVRDIASLEHVKVAGLMTMGTGRRRSLPRLFPGNEAVTRRYQQPRYSQRGTDRAFHGDDGQLPGSHRRRRHDSTDRQSYLRAEVVLSVNNR